MKIEMVEFEADEAMHAQHTEIVVFTTTDTPLGPGAWPKVWEALDRDQRELLGDQCGTHSRSALGTTTPGSACKFDVDSEHEMDPELRGYVQWWAFPKK